MTGKLTKEVKRVGWRDILMYNSHLSAMPLLPLVEAQYAVAFMTNLRTRNVDGGQLPLYATVKIISFYFRIT